MSAQDTNFKTNYLSLACLPPIMKYLRFHPGHFIKMLAVFSVEVFIALFVHDAFIRPYVGDVIAVAFVYYFVRAFLSCKPVYAAFMSLTFAFAVEYGQYVGLISFLGLRNNELARIVLGTSFSWGDVLCYIAGFALLFLLDPELRKKH